MAVRTPLRTTTSCPLFIMVCPLWLTAVRGLSADALSTRPVRYAGESLLLLPPLASEESSSPPVHTSRVTPRRWRIRASFVPYLTCSFVPRSRSITTGPALYLGSRRDDR